MIKTLYESFQHWSDGGNVRIISDPHFGDKDMQIYFGYPHPQIMVNRINKGMNKNDTLVILGDVGDETWVRRIKSKRKILVMGNHDKGVTVYKPYFNEVYQGVLMIAEKIMLSHERVNTDWCLNIHGHHHGKKSYDKYHINACPELINFTPINLNEVIKSGALKLITSLHGQAINGAKIALLKEERCANCALRLDIEELDYSQGGCIHTSLPGFACMAFGCENHVCWLYGLDEDSAHCEGFTPRKVPLDD